jgi:hypothetical protein
VGGAGGGGGGFAGPGPLDGPSAAPPFRLDQAGPYLRSQLAAITSPAS